MCYTPNMNFVGRNVSHWQLAEGLKDGDVRHGLSDGRWSLVDLISCIATEVGPDAELDLAVWTASGDHGKRLSGFILEGRLAKVRLLIDRSFQTRQPASCQAVRDAYGDDAIRVWSSHAKFAIFHGGRVDVLAMFSANLNRNPRVENFTIWCDSTMVREYRALVDEAYACQTSGEGFRSGPAGRRLTSDLLGPFGDRDSLL